MKKYSPVVLIIIDGFGISPDKIGSPWEIASHTVFSEIEKFYPFTAIQASGMAVGLPWGEAGNSEVGHLTMGAGKIIFNYLPRISISINDHTFFSNEAFLQAVAHINPLAGGPPDETKSLHLVGLFSTGTVHAYFEHLYALLNFAKQQKVKNVCLHLFTDGKDAYKKEGAEFYKKLEKDLEQNCPNIKIASIMGRNFAMDRDNKWAKTEKAYNLFVNGEGEEFDSASSYIQNQYEKDIFDQIISPAFAKASPELRIKDNDAVIFFNFREDSMRQLAHSFIDKEFDKFPRKNLNNVVFVTMTEYDKTLQSLVAFKSAEVEQPLAKILSENGLKQLHIAETEKYAHITYFLNGGRETPFANEDRILVESPDVPSYDQAPEMSAKEITEDVVSNIGKYDFIAINFANADMVGHTGNFVATTKAFEVLDICVGKIMEKVLELGGAMIITSDHGNAEEKIYKVTGEEKTKHSINPVPFYLISSEAKKEKPASEEEIKESYKTVKGTLTDVAPTILELMGIKKPESMTGKSLLEKLK
jgi:2,3-bisphosphoglycerate-independent phosphoglycerate mutase